LTIAILLCLTVTAVGAIKRKNPITEGGGPDLPYPCWMVRWYASMYSGDQLEQMGRANGITLSPKQRRQAVACIRGAA